MAVNRDDLEQILGGFNLGRSRHPWTQDPWPTKEGQKARERLEKTIIDPSSINTLPINQNSTQQPQQLPVKNKKNKKGQGTRFFEL